ncbi:MAG: 30S ribosomal protein S6 [bacterium]
MEKKNELKEERKQVYEAGFHIIPTVSEDIVAEKTAAIRSLIESNGGTIISEEFPKSRALAYTLVKPSAGVNKRYHSAYFGWFKFEAPSEAAGAVKKGLDNADYILRHLIVKTVRENTMSNLTKILGQSEEGAETTKKPAEAAAVVAPALSAEEINKSIEKMVE